MTSLTLKYQTLYFEKKNNDSGGKWAAYFESNIYFTIRRIMTSLWRHKRQNQTVCFEKKNSVLVQNERFEQLWRHYDVTNTLSQKLDYLFWHEQ